MPNRGDRLLVIDRPPAELVGTTDGPRPKAEQSNLGSLSAEVALADCLLSRLIRIGYQSAFIIRGRSRRESFPGPISPTTAAAQRRILDGSSIVTIGRGMADS